MGGCLGSGVHLGSSHKLVVEQLQLTMCTFFGAHRKFPDMVTKCAHLLPALLHTPTPA